MVRLQASFSASQTNEAVPAKENGVCFVLGKIPAKPASPALANPGSKLKLAYPLAHWHGTQAPQSKDGVHPPADPEHFGD